jgi:predicted Zn-dependent protease
MVPLDPEDDRGIRQQAFRATSRAYHNALERYQAVRAGRNIKVDIEDKTGDFSPTKPVVFIGERAKLEPFDASLWHEQLRKLSARLARRPEITDSTVLLDQTAQNRWILTSEGTKVQTGEASARLTIHAEARADDGMDLTRDETLDAHQLARLPDAAKLEGLVTQVADDLVKLRQAPLAEPYVGPAILVGRAAAVMFHEIFGHRVEGERQKEEDEAQTFAKKVGETVTSDFIDIYDDPTLTRFGGIDLLGHYRFDDEGIAAEPVSLISAGKLQGFLLSRVPVRGKNSSNGHGRRMIGSPSVHARQGNLVIQARQTVPFSVLRERLIAEAKRQSRPYGLLFAEISGGLTQTARGSTQGFKVTPVMVYRVYVDGRKDELIRGVDIVGTPLTGLTKILAASDDYAVFNGSCGAESGWVSVSAISPSLLIGQIEVALREKGNARPPVLPPPALATR